MAAFEATDDVTAVIDVAAGQVRIVAGAAGAAIADVRPLDPENEEDVRAAQLTRVEFAKGELLVRSPRPRAGLGRRPAPAVVVAVEVPPGTRVDGSGQLTDFHLDGTLGACRVRTEIGRIQLEEAASADLKAGIGDVVAERVHGHADVVLASGEVRLRELLATAAVKNSNGDTWVGVARGDLRVKSANGSIAIGRAEASVVARSAHGDVRVGEAVRDEAVLETRVGDIEVGVPEGTAAWLDVRSGTGRVRSELEAAAEPAPTDETVEVRARTAAGSVLIRRPAPAAAA